MLGLLIDIIPFFYFNGSVILLPNSGHICCSGISLQINDITNENKPNPIHISHYSIVRPSLWQVMGKLPNVTISTYKIRIQTIITINNVDCDIPSSTLYSSESFLLLKKLKIYNQTNVLKTIVKCLDGPYNL